MSAKNIAKAVEIAGSQTALADLLGVSKVAVNQWLSGERPVPAGRCIAIEEATNGAVTRYDLRPAIFGQDPSKSAARRSSAARAKAA